MNAIDQLSQQQRANAPRIWRGSGDYRVRVIDPAWAERELVLMRARQEKEAKKHKASLAAAVTQAQAAADECMPREVVRVVEAVCDRHRVFFSEILKPSRHRGAFAARSHAAYELRRQLRLSLPTIARILQRDHTSILRAIQFWPDTAAEMRIPCEPMPEGFTAKAERKLTRLQLEALCWLADQEAPAYTPSERYSKVWRVTLQPKGLVEVQHSAGAYLYSLTEAGRRAILSGYVGEQAHVQA